MRNTTNGQRRVAGVAALGIVTSLSLFGCGALPSTSSAPANSTQEQTQSSTDSSSKGDGSEAGSNALDENGNSAAKSKKSSDGRLNLLVLVNKENAIPSGWDEKLELEGATNIKGDYIEVDKIAFDAFKELQEDLEKNEGITIELNSGYRSVADQQSIYDEFLADYGQDYVDEFVSDPGHSEHHTGLALDALLVENGEPIVTNEDIFAHQDTWDTIHSYLAKHGFILRYPEGKEDITNVSYEPWHLRYVGVEDAKKIESEGVTLEEYLGEA